MARSPSATSCLPTSSLAVLQDFVDQHLSSTGQPPAIKPVMGGTFVQQIICQGVDYTSEREEEFYQISVDVKGMGCLEKSLDDYVKVSDLGPGF